jgi:hypothetical protein
MSDRKRVLRIHVKEGDDDKVNITVPLGLAKLAKIGGLAEKLEERHGIDLEEILEDIEDAPDGKMIDVLDEKTGDHVEIFIETVGATAEARA